MSTQNETMDKIKATLSKQSTDQLLSKLTKGTLLNNSKAVALEILKKRNVEVSAYEDSVPEETKAIKAEVVKGKRKLDVDQKATKKRGEKSKDVLDLKETRLFEDESFIDDNDDSDEPLDTPEPKTVKGSKVKGEKKDKSSERDSEIIRRYNKGESVYQIKKEMGIAYGVAARVVAKKATVSPQNEK